MLLNTIISGLVGLVTGAIGSFIGFTCWPWLRRNHIWKNLNVVVEETVAGAVRCRVVNGSSFTMGKVLVYLTLHHEHTDVLEGRTSWEGYISPRTLASLRECQLCWEV